MRRLVVGNFDGGMIGSDGGSSICAATPNAGYSFSAFSGACYGASCALTNVTSAKNVTAAFTPIIVR